MRKAAVIEERADPIHAQAFLLDGDHRGVVFTRGGICGQSADARHEIRPALLDENIVGDGQLGLLGRALDLRRDQRAGSDAPFQFMQAEQ